MAYTTLDFSHKSYKKSIYNTNPIYNWSGKKKCKLKSNRFYVASIARILYLGNTFTKSLNRHVRFELINVIWKLTLENTKQLDSRNLTGLFNCWHAIFIYVSQAYITYLLRGNYLLIFIFNFKICLFT
jgi:hypothetical protein